MKVKLDMKENNIRKMQETYGYTVYKIAFSYSKNNFDADF